MKENGGLPPLILWTLSIVAGISVANLYYNQPLLNMIRHDLDVSEFTTNLIAMVTQIGYALGLLFVVPLADMYKRKKIIVTNFALLVLSLFMHRHSAQHSYNPDCFIIYRHLFGNTTNIHTHRRHLFKTGKQRT